MSKTAKEFLDEYLKENPNFHSSGESLFNSFIGAMEAYHQYKSKWRSFENDPPEMQTRFLVCRGRFVKHIRHVFASNEKEMTNICNKYDKWHPLPQE